MTEEVKSQKTWHHKQGFVGGDISWQLNNEDPEPCEADDQYESNVFTFFSHSP